MPGQTQHISVCPHDCPSVCALEIERIVDHPDDRGRLGKVRGSERNPYTAGVICAKVARYAERFHHPDRLTRPLRRVGAKGSGSFVPIAWDDALDEVAEAFSRAAQRFGSETVWPYYYAGTMGLVQRDGINRLRHAMRYSGWHSTICVMLSDVGWKAGHGKRWGVPGEEMAHSDLIVIWGTNPVSTQVNVMTHVARARKARGAKLVVVDPYRSNTAALADVHLALRPGTDGALACAVMHVLFRDGYADRAYLARYADDVAELEAHLASRTPEWAARITGLPVEQIEDFSRLYGRTRRSYLRLGFGFTRSRNGAANMHAASCLPVVTGAWQHEGGGALYNQGDLYHWDKTVLEGLDRLDPKIRLLDQSRIGPVLVGDRQDLGDGPPVKALLIQSTNPMAVAPELKKVHAGFSREDLFVCVHEQFMTETARIADIVLPATMFLEHDDIYQASGHTRIQIARKIFEPFAECRTNHFVVCALAGRLGTDHPGFGMTEWQLIDDLLHRSGWPDAQTIDEAGGWDALPDYETAHHLNGFPTPSGRFQFKPDWSKFGPDHARMPKLPDHLAIIDEVGEEHPFRLVAAPARHYLNTSFTEMPTSRCKEGRPTALIHPDDAARLKIEAGDLVRLGNQRGSVLLHAAIREGQQPGIVVVESIWPNEAFIEGIGINVLISAEPAPPNGGAAFHDTAVWLRREPVAAPVSHRTRGADRGVIDLYSDTRTRPTAGMRRAIAEAEVGDEQAMLDPTVNRLCDRVADLLGKEAAVYLPSGTMCNQIAARVHCRQGDEIILSATAHPLHAESGGPAALAGVMMRGLHGERGMFSAEQVRAAINAPDWRHAPRSRLLEVENTTNHGGGAVWPIAQIRAVTAVAREHGLACHMDGARLMNAVVASGTPAADYAAPFDSLWLDFSKGLGAPVGAVLAGAKDFVHEAWRVKQQIGGAMRQAGIIAAACLYALDHHVERLAEDHANAKALAEGLAQIPGIELDPGSVETNIVWFDVRGRLSANEVAAALKEQGVLIGSYGQSRMRAVTHLDVDRAGIEVALQAVARVLS